MNNEDDKDYENKIHNFQVLQGDSSNIGFICVNILL